MKHLFYYLLIMLLIFSCKKKDNVEAPIKIKYDKEKVVIIGECCGLLRLMDFNNPQEYKAYEFKWDTYQQQFLLDQTILNMRKHSNTYYNTWPQNVDKVYGTYSRLEAIPHGTADKVLNYTNSMWKEDDFENIWEYRNLPARWKLANKIKGGVGLHEKYNASEDSYNFFLFDFPTREYVFYNAAKNVYIDGNKISGLINKPNGNMDKDPIDWTKADQVLIIPRTVNGKKLNQLVFLDLETNTYASFTRFAEGDLLNGDDKGRQTLLTTSWQPISNLIQGWPL